MLGMQDVRTPEEMQGTHDIQCSLQSYLADIDEAAVALVAVATSRMRLYAAPEKRYRHRVDLKGRNHSQSLILAAWAIIMGEYAHSRDVLFGVKQDDGRIMPLRVLLGGEDGIAHLVCQVDRKQDMLKELLSDVSLPTIQNVLIVTEGDKATPDTTLAFEGNQVMYLQCWTHEGNLDITARTKYLDTDSVSIRRLLEQLETVLEQLYVRPAETAIKQVCSITRQDIRDISRWNDVGQKSYVVDSILGVFGQRVAQAPNAYAVNGWDGTLTYAQLEHESSCMANYLELAGVRAQDLVPLAFEKSIWYTVSVLSVLKLGAALVPLDPQWPKDRRMYIIKDAGSRLVLTNVRGSESDYPDMMVIQASDASHADGPLSIKPPVTPADAAYVFYTSGTTGQPKGCIIEHGAFVASALERAAAFGRNESSRVLQVTTHTFDPSMEDILTTLMVGGCVCVPTRDECLSDLAGAITRYDADTLNIAPSFMRTLRPDQVPSLKTLLLGGEAMSRSVLQTWAGAVSLFNGYGPTECCIKSTINAIHSVETDPLNIGRPVGCSAWITRDDDPDTLAAIGTVGEILIHGPNLARGYLNQPEQTARAFCRNLRWAAQVGLDGHCRFYRTGDLGRLNPDGSIRIMGRKDDQVKIHSQRIELSEIDHHLRDTLPAGVEAVAGVVTFKDRDSPSLVAFMQMGDAKTASHGRGGSLTLVEYQDEVHSLRALALEQLSLILPSYMVPSVFLPVQSFLYQSQGKTDRSSMCRQASQLCLQDVVTRFSRPATEGPSQWSEATTVLHRLWSLALNLSEEVIGVSDNFFHLGGDSLIAIHLAALCRTHHIFLTVDDIVQHPTIVSQVERIRAGPQQVLAAWNHTGCFALLPGDVDVDSLQQEVAGICHVSSDAVEDIYPASAMQESLMALSMDRSPYMSQFVFRIPDDVHQDALRIAWERAVGNIPILRTRIVHVPGAGTLQVLVRKEEAATDLWTETSGRVTLAQFLHVDKEITMGPGSRLVRLALVHEAAAEGQPHSSFLVWTCHHACHDGRTVGQILSQVEAFYLDRQTHHPSVPYQRYVQFQRDLNQQNWAAYWGRKLAGASIPAFPPQDDADLQPRTNASHHHSFNLPARRVGTSPASNFSTATYIRAAWALLVSRYEGSNDATFGTVVGGDSSRLAGADTIIGPTNNTIPINIQVPEDSTVQSFLSHVRAQFSPSPFHHVGLAQLKDLSVEMRNITDLRSLFVLQHPPNQRASVLGLQRITVAAHEDFRYPLVVECTLEPAEMLAVTFVYDSNVIDAAQISRLAVQLENAVYLLCSNTASAVLVGNIDILTPSDMAQIQDWQVGEVPRPRFSCLHHGVLEQARVRPDAPAVNSWDGLLTYRALEDLSSRLALYLQERGVRPGHGVLYRVEKSTCAVITMLAVLRCGAACIPLGVSWPRSRSQTVAGDIEAGIALASPGYATTVAGLASNVVEVTTVFIRGLPRGVQKSDDAARPSDTAFILHTSGSTGAPKAVPLPHDGLVTNLSAIAQHMRYSSQTRGYQFSDFAFDLSLSDIFGVLLSGGCVCMPSEQERAEDIVGSMNRYEVNVATLTPSVAKTLRPSDVPTVRFLMTGGEILSSDILETWAGCVDMIHAYGVTESSIWSTNTALLKTDSDPRGIGRGINCLTWIADANHPDRLAPIGAVGELVLQGPGVGSGYLNRPEETSRLFPHTLPWSSDSNRAYRTGDLVKYAADGTLLFAGRRDNQFKIRGQRFEAGEVEFHLRQCGLPEKTYCVDIVQALAVTYSVSTLALFVVFGDGMDLGVSGDLKIVRRTPQQKHVATDNAIGKAMQFLPSRLPSYMVPKLIIPVSRMPLSGSGKLDRRALRNLVAGLSYVEMRGLFDFLPEKEDSQKMVPSTNFEKIMSSLWARVLPVHESHVFDVNDNFFHLGGHSIAVMRLASVARAQGILINFRDAFLHPTLGAMSRRLASKGQEENVVYHSIAPFALVSPEDIEGLIREAAATCQLDPAKIVDLYPCTPVQEAMMTLSLSKLGLYTANFVWSLPEDMDIERFKSAWDAMALSNPMLRTRLVYTGRYWQVVTSDTSPWTFTEADLAPYLERERARPMGLGDPLSRLALVRDLGSGAMHVVWTCHHSIYDGHSVALAQKWLSAFYLANRKLPLVPFNVFVNCVIQNAQSESHIAFWKEAMHGARQPSFPKLPSSDYRASVNEVVRDHITLPNMCRTDVTIASVIQAAWAILLAKYEDSDDVLFAMSLNGRNTELPGIENIGGPTLCTVPMRVMFNSEPDVGTYLKNVQASYVDAATYGQTGLDTISKLSAGAEIASGIRSLLVVQSPSIDRGEGLEKIDCSKVETNIKDFVSYPLVIECAPDMTSNTMELKISYDKNVIVGTDTYRLMRQLEHILKQLLCESCKTMSDVSLTSPHDIETISKWNQKLPPTVNHTVHGMFAKQLIQRPDAPSICSWDGNMTYSQLDDASSRLAMHFMAQGVQPESYVPLCFAKSMWAVVSMLAVLKAGATCVNLDPNDPADHHSKILARISADIVVTDRPNRQKFAHTRMIAVDSALLNTTVPHQPSILPGASPSNPAFVVFTSGTTGEPKGIILEHNALCTSIQAHGQYMKFGPESRVLQFASYTFDVSIADIFTTLLFGGCVCIPSDSDRMNNLSGTIVSLGVNQAYLTSSVAGLLNADDIQSRLRVLSVGGERVSQDIVQTWGDRTLLINMYGPAETTIWCGGKSGVKPGDDAADIGSGVGSRMWLADPNDVHRLVPIGAVGEILIEGPLLAREYLDDAGRTSAAFVRTPRWARAFENVDGFDPVVGRVYRSGDLGRSRSDGSILICGRRDTQVKLRGQRVELSQIEMHIHRLLPQYRCVVDVSFAQDGTQGLVAYVGLDIPLLVGTATEAMTFIASAEEIPIDLVDMVDSLEPQLANVLPSYLVPSQYLVLRQIPLLASGKTDRKKLRDVARASLGSRQITIPQVPAHKNRIPSTAMEWNIYSLWAQVLGVTNLGALGVDDNFFRCGGDSLKAMHLVSLAAQRGISVQVADVFRFPIMADLAEALESRASKPEAHLEPTTTVRVDVRSFELLNGITREEIMTQAAEDCGVSAGLVEDVYPCTHLQQGLFALSQKQPGTYVAQLIFRVSRKLNIRRLRQAWEAVCQQSPILRTRFVSTPSGLYQAVLAEDFWWCDRQDIDTSAALHKDKAAIGGPARPMQRFRLCRDVKTGQRKLFWTIHHAVYDGWSVQRILESVQRVYQDRPTLTAVASFKDFVQYAVDVASKDEARHFWASQLADATPPSFPAMPSPDYHPVANAMSELTVPNLKTPHSVTLTTLLRAAWAIVVGAHQGSDDVVFLTTISGRSAPLPCINAIIGPTIATIPVRIRMDDHNVTIAAFLQSIQDAATEAIAFEQIGLRSIAKISEDCEAACNAQNLLVVQPGELSRPGDGLKGFEKLPDESTDFSTFPFTLECSMRADDTLALSAVFDSNVMTSARVGRILRQFKHVAIQLCDDSNLKVCDIDPISPSDMDDISSWNAMMPATKNYCIHHELERLAVLHPDTEAVCSWDGRLTFRELDELSERFAAHLQRQGVHVESLVPICFDKSLWAIVAMLAILKAGAASVAIDPRYPEERRNTILSAVSASVVITTSTHAPLFHAKAPARHKTIVLDEAMITGITASSLLKTATLPTNACFVVFTSGSTGTPKAIVIEHRGICTGAYHLGNLLGFGPRTRIFQFAAYTFDQSFGDIFHTLLRSGCVCIPSENDRMNDLAGSIRRLRANTAFLTPTVACSINLQDLGPHRMEALSLGGEAVTAEAIRAWAPHTRLHNTYGPAECSVTCIGRSIGLWNTAQPGNIGHGLGALIWLTCPGNPDRLAPIGTVGEILIEGPLLGRGYLNDEEKTRAAYIVDPAWARRLSVAGVTGPRRFYRTGDLGEYQEDGTIHCLGRYDSQVKLRGQRIELQEIEHHISAHIQPTPEVVVDVFNPPGGSAILVACVSIQSEMNGDGGCRLLRTTESLANFRSALSGLEVHLARLLPLHMVPALYIPVSLIPRTTSGKKDRKYLRTMLSTLSMEILKETGRLSEHSQPARPLNDRERCLQRLWMRVLKMSPETDKININDNFFRSGGDSIRAMTLVAAARSEGLHLTVSDIFGCPELGNMAAIMDSGAVETTPVVLVPYSMLPPHEVDNVLSEASVACQVNQSTITDVYPATPLQQGLMMLSIKDAGTYVSRFVFRLPQSIEVERLQRAWEQVYELSAALRTRIVDIPAAGMLQVVVSQQVNWSYSDTLEAHPEHQEPSPLWFGQSLAESTIVQERDGAVFFVLTLHHAIYDGWSLQRLLSATERSYLGLSSLCLAPFNAFVKHVSQIEAENSSTFWRSYLSGAPRDLLFPQQPVSFKPIADEIVSHRIELRRSATWRSGITTTALLRAAWALILAAYNCDSDGDIVFGTVTSGRTTDVIDIEYIDGPTVATIPFRVQFDPAGSILGLLQSVQNMTSELIPHEQFGLQNIMRVSEDAHAAGQFQTVLVVQHEPGLHQEDEEAPFQLLDLGQVHQRPDKPPSIPVVIECTQSALQVRVKMHFDARLVEDFQAERMMRQFAHVFEQLMGGEHSQKITDIEVISPSDLNEINHWNSAVLPSLEGCLSDMVLHQAETYPGRAAINSWDASLTYHDLDCLSAKLAHYLHGRGVGPEVRVPFCMEKSAFTIISMFAILRCGGCFVPLDPSSPQLRNEDIVKRIDAQLVLVSNNTRLLFRDMGCALVVVNRSMIESLPMLPSRHDANPSPHHAAYVLFTSGSTGTPKGVVIEHRAIATSVSCFASHLGFGPHTRVLQFAPYVFDVSIGEIFGSLTSGGCLCIAPETQLMNDLQSCIRNMNVDFAVLTPTFAETITPSDVPCLKTLVLGGEPVRKNIVEVWSGHVRLFNGYGPTEASVMSYAHLSDAESPPNLIGTSVGCRGWIVNPKNIHVLSPVGVVGELLLEGNNLARGYLEAGPTQDAFFTNPAFSRHVLPMGTNMRVYRTGDLVRYHANGTIQFICRKDNQVKFHGRRIELEEVEQYATMAMPEATHLAAELAYTSGNKHQVLALFFHTETPDASNHQQLLIGIDNRLRSRVQEVKSSLLESLPHYMVPSLWLPLSSWPSTVSGKVDRRFLRGVVSELSPDMLAHHYLHLTESSSPSLSVQERQLAQIWATTLNIDKDDISSNDSFLQHGGDSIAAVRLVTIARRQGVALSVDTVLTRPLLRDMALHISSMEAGVEEMIGPFSLIADRDEEIRQAGAQCGIDPTLIEDIYPCSALQHGLVALSAKNPSAYTSQFVLTVPEGMDASVVQTAWDTVVLRTPILRTRFFHPSSKSTRDPIMQAVIRGRAEWTKADHLQDYLHQDKQRPMKIGLPMARFAIVEDKSKQGAFLVLTAHHSVYDGWSLASVFEHVEQALTGIPIAPTTEYNAFIRHVMSLDWEASSMFWSRSLDGAPQVTFPELPSHTYEPTTDDFLEHSFELPVDASILGSGITMATVVRGAWALLVSKYCDTLDVVFGITTNGRMASMPGMDTVQGPTITTVPFRAKFDATQSALSYLEQLHTQSIQLIPHEQFGLHNIKSLNASTSSLCGFQNLLVTQTHRESVTEGTSPVLSVAQSNDSNPLPITGFHNLALVVECTIRPGTVEVAMSFDSNVIPRAQVRRIAHHFQHVVLQLLPASSSPSLKLYEINHVSPQDLAEMLEWNNSVPESVQLCVHELFEERARIQPEAPAICSHDGQLTYAELDSRANALAAYLVTQGLGPGDLVPLVFEKSCWTIVSMLAVLKSGAANVALNPEHPEARLQGLIDATQSEVILSSRTHFELAINFGAQVIVVDDELCVSLDSQNTSFATTRPTIATPGPDDPAFVLFTSGTTGIPKGVVINHAAFCSSIHGHASTLRFSTGPDSRNFQFTAYTSDVSIGEIFTSLAVGSCVCVPSDYDRMNNLAGSIRDLGVNWAFLTPSVAALLTPQEVPGLRTLLFGGEVATSENISTWAESLCLINSAGPAECSIWTHCNPGVSSSDMGNNWGHNLGCATWITNPNDSSQLMPIGVVGEMLIEGPSLAQGYLHDPDRTQKAFIHRTLGGKDRRLYRTGDLARLMTDGKTQFIGRKDTQVKLRGQRIEIGEIENQIRRHVPTSILVAVGMVRTSGGKSAPLLAAFLARKDSPNKDENGKVVDVEVVAPKDCAGIREIAAGLDHKLAEFLPGHMIPSALFSLTRMPLTASAKTDRNVLAVLATTIHAEQLRHYSFGSTEKQAPSTTTEERLVILWHQALQLDVPIGRHDSFFRIGGDSISAMRLVSVARSAGLSVTVEQIFRNPTLQQMAVATAASTLPAEADSMPPFALIPLESTANVVRAEARELCQVSPEQIDDIYPCSPLQEGLLALSLKAPGSYLAQMVFSIPAEFDVNKFKEAWDCVASGIAPILRTRFFESPSQEHRLMQVVVNSPLHWTNHDSLDRYLAADASDSIQLGQPTSRFAVVSDARKGRFFIFTAHHAIYDGASLHHLFESVRQCYSTKKLPKAVPFSLFIDYILQTDPASSRNFWEKTLDGALAPTFPRMPSSGYLPAANDFLRHIVAAPFRHDTEFTASTLIRAAWSLVVAAHSETDDEVVFASTVGGRTLPIPFIEKIIGPTLATVPIRVTLDRSVSVGDFLTALQQQSTEMLPHEQYGMQNIKSISPSTSAVCEVHSLLVINAAIPGKSDEGGLGLEQVDQGQLMGFHNFALSLECTLQSGSLDLAVSFDNNVIDPSQMRRLVSQFEHVLQQLSISGSQERLLNLTLISPAEIEEIHRWNSTVPEPQQLCVHTIVEKRAQLQPDSSALCSWEGELTYRQLDHLSSALANHLIDKYAVGPGILVPLLFEKSIWTVVTMLAVLKAGGANVPLDPEQPLPRLIELAASIGTRFAISSSKYRLKASEVAETALLVHPDALANMEAGPVRHQSQEPSLTDPAFILFTSGSTGKPKGIIIDHVAFASSMKGHAEVLRFRKGSRNLQVTAYTSDVSIGEIFTSLSVGACICVPSDFERMNDLAGAMERMRVDWAFLTPSMASLLDAGKVPTLKTLLFGGETASPENIATWATRLCLINSFGPAECSIWTHCDPGVGEGHNGTHVGYAIGCATWIVNPTNHHKLVPIGAVGELVIEGPNVAKGYLNNEAKTREAFLTSAAWMPAGRKSRLYKMGDLVRYLPDGKIQFLGRKDALVKLHGQRIELGEIEHQIRAALDSTKHSVAVELVSLGTESAQPFLAAFLDYEGQTPDDGPADLSVGEKAQQWVSKTADNIRGRLTSMLPRHMVPHVLLPLTRMPLNASAKTDRKILRRIVSGLDMMVLSSYSMAPREGKGITAPDTPNEKTLHHIWATVLSIPAETFGTEANFMALGGDSISAMKMVPVAQAAGVSISVADIFAHPVLRDMAQALEMSVNGVNTRNIEPFSLIPHGVDLEEIFDKIGLYTGLEPDAIQDIYPCTRVQTEFITTTHDQPGAYTLQDVFGIPPTVDLDLFRKAWSQTVECHASLRTRILPMGVQGEHVQVVEKASTELNWIESTNLGQYLKADRATSMAFGEPLVRSALVSEEGSHYFVFTCHHSVYDAASLKIIMDDLENFYKDPSYEVQEPQYSAFVHHVNQLSPRGLSSQFWMEHLAGNGQKVTPLFQPIKDGLYEPRVDTLLTRTITFPVSYRHSKLNLTMAALTYAALSLAVARMTGSCSAVLELTLLGRNVPVPGIERMVGTTVTSAPLRIDITGDNATGGEGGDCHWTLQLKDYLAYVQRRVNGISAHDHTGMSIIRSLCLETQSSALAALPVVVHPSNPQKEPLGSGIGLVRQEIRTMGQSSSAFYMAVSGVGGGDGLEVNLPFDSRVADPDIVRGLVGLFEAAVVGIIRLSSGGGLDTRVGNLGWEAASFDGIRMEEYRG